MVILIFLKVCVGAYEISIKSLNKTILCFVISVVFVIEQIYPKCWKCDSEPFSTYILNFKYAQVKQSATNEITYQAKYSIIPSSYNFQSGPVISHG